MPRNRAATDSSGGPNLAVNTSSNTARSASSPSALASSLPSRRPFSIPFPFPTGHDFHNFLPLLRQQPRFGQRTSEPQVFRLSQTEVRIHERCLDTGASDCLFDAHYADLLGIDVRSGFEKTYRTVAGSFRAFGHEVTIVTLGFEWLATVFFYESSNPANAFVGRRGWLDRVRLGLVHYEQDIYLSQYSR